MNNKTDYMTLDVYLAGYLSLNGLAPRIKKLEGADKVGFFFDNDSARAMVKKYYDEKSVVNPFLLVREIKHMRGLMMNAKGEITYGE